MHHKEKRKDIIRRVIVYIVMTVSVVAMLGLCLFFVLGYSVDEKTGKTERGGLIQFRSFPETATVSLDGSVQSTATPSKANALAGYHSVTMNKKGYREWKKNTTLKSGELLWLNALLVPQTVKTGKAMQFNEMTSFVVSPDKKWAAVTEKAADPVVKVIDLRNPEKPLLTPIVLTQEITGEVKPTDSFSITEWDFGSRYILVRHTSGAETHWIRVDRADSKNSKNISTTLDVAISEQHFSGTGGNVFYGLSGGALRKFNIDQNTISSPVAVSVDSFQLYKDNILAYVTKKDGMQTVGYYMEGDKKPTTIKTFRDEFPVRVTTSSYFNDNYIAIAHGNDVEVFMNPQSSDKKRITKFSMKEPVQWVYFSYNGQFVVAQHGSALASYNLERDEKFSYTIPGNPAYIGTEHLQWLDDFHLWSDQGNSLVIFEFDGSNPQTIGSVTPGYDVSLSENGKRMFSIGTATTGTTKTLQSSLMVIE